MGNDPRFEALYQEIGNKYFNELEQYREKAIIEQNHKINTFGIIGIGILALIILSFVLMFKSIPSTQDPTGTTVDPAMSGLTQMIKFLIIIIVAIAFAVAILTSLNLKNKREHGTNEERYNENFKRAAMKKQYVKSNVSAIKEYKRIYDERVLGTIIRSFDPSFSYNHDEKLDHKIFAEAEFNDNYNIFKSEDLIQGNYKNKYDMKIAEVHTQLETEYTDSEGHTERNTYEVFHGLFAVANISTKPFTDSIFIRKNKTKGTDKDLKVELDSAVFEQYFDVYSTNKIFTYQIMTSDTMQFLLNFVNAMRCECDFTIKNGKLYIRFKCGPILETPGPMDYPLNKQRLYTYYSILSFTFVLIDKLIATIEQTEF